MSGFFKNKHRFSLALGAVFLAVTIFVASLVYFTDGLSTLLTQEVAGQESSGDASEPETEPEETAPVSEAVDEIINDMDYVVSYNVPSEMRGTFLVPGVDFLKTKDTSEATIKKEIDDAFLAAKDLTINAVIIDTAYEDYVIYQTMDAPEIASSFDVLGYIVDRARQEDFYTYAIFDAASYSRKQLVTAMAVGAGTINKLSGNLEEFAGKYQLDGILLDGYQNDGVETSYSDYLNIGGGMGFGNFMRQSPAAVVKTASQTIRKSSPSTQVGLLADAVWENRSSNEEGSATEAAFTALSSGNADTKGFIEKGFVDFVAVKAYTTIESTTEPFAEVAKWWADVARQNDIPMYIVHAADKIGSGESGWGSQDQILKQVIEAAEISGVRGSIFNRLAPLASTSTSLGNNLTKLYTNEAEPEQVLTQLEMTKPEQTNYTTSEPVVTFTGASDPGEPVTINDEKVDTDKTGYFTVQMQLKSGLNNFTIKHKEKTISYAITRKIEVLQSAAPMGDVTVEGGMTLTITAVAYAEADVYATVGGQTIAMSIDDSVEDEQDRDGSFRTFVGEYKAPAAAGEVQTIGGITVHAGYEGESNSIQGGTVKVNKKAKVGDGVAVRVVADQAITYPPDTSNNIPAATYYPLPQGAMDYAVGDEITYTKTNNKGKQETFTYFVLASGLRVESKDIAAITDDYPSNNVISGLTVTTDSRYTYVTLKTAQKVTYSVNYTSSAIGFKFHNTTSVPSDLSLSKNPLFNHAGWSDTTLTLTMSSQGSFMGYKGYYDESGNLVLRFKNPPSSIAGARIAIDPGHGGVDNGTSGFLADYPEKVLNQQIASYLAAELEARGATVNLMNNAGIEGPERKQRAEQWGADLFVSVHNNSAPNANATGTEVFYFHPFSYRLANAAASSVSSGLNTNNRGAKASYYHVTLSSQFPSVLVECGFLSNRGEYEKLVTKGYQQSVAVGIADSLSATIKSTYPGNSASGTESTGTATTPGEQGQNSSDSSGSGSGEPAADLYLNDAVIGVGKTTELKVDFYPDGSTAELTWKSSDTKVAKVENGKVTGVKAGTATITASTKDGLMDQCTVTVSEDAGETASASSESANTADSGVALSSVSDAYFDYNEVSVNPSTTMRLEIISPSGDTIQGGDFRWSSSDTSIATVDSKGYVTAKAYGEAKISAAASGYSLECYVNVTNTQFKVTGLSFEKAALSMIRNEALTLRPIFSPANATNKKLTWSSSDSYKASVDQNGLVTAKKPGTVTITAKTNDGGFTAKCTVTITSKAVEVTSIELASRIEVRQGETEQLYCTVLPNDASDQGVTWSSNSPNTVSVDQNGSITAIRTGTAVITCTTKSNPDISSRCTVTVI